MTVRHVVLHKGSVCSRDSAASCFEKVSYRRSEQRFKVILNTLKTRPLRSMNRIYKISSSFLQPLSSTYSIIKYYNILHLSYNYTVSEFFWESFLIINIIKVFRTCQCLNMFHYQNVRTIIHGIICGSLCACSSSRPTGKIAAFYWHHTQ